MWLQPGDSVFRTDANGRTSIWIIEADGTGTLTRVELDGDPAAGRAADSANRGAERRRRMGKVMAAVAAVLVGLLGWQLPTLPAGDEFAQMLVPDDTPPALEMASDEQVLSWLE